MEKTLEEASGRLWWCALQGMSLGIGLSGLIVSAISFITLWWCPPAAKHLKTPAEAAPEAFGYFLLSSIIIVAGIVTYFMYFRTAYVIWHRRPKGTAFPAVYNTASCSSCHVHDAEMYCILLSMFSECAPAMRDTH